MLTMFPEITYRLKNYLLPTGSLGSQVNGQMNHIMRLI